MMRGLLLLAALAAGAGRAAAEKGLEVAALAGGCFWCMQPPYDGLDGVVSTVVGYTGGALVDPTYEQVSRGGTGHVEAVEVTFDPSKISYEEILEVFWRNVDPTDPGGQFCDRGEPYRSAIFYHGEDQKRAAEGSKARREREGCCGGKSIVTEITAASAFYPAEEYHQNYYRKNPVRYKIYRYNCGRDKVLEKVWGRKGGRR